MVHEELFKTGEHKNHAKAAMNSLYEMYLFSEDKGAALAKLLVSKEAMVNSAHKNMLFKNSIKYFFHDLKKENFEMQLKHKKEKIWAHYSQSSEKLSVLASNKIRRGSTVFIASYSDLIEEIIDQASKTKEFHVIITETNPLAKHTQRHKNVRFTIVPDLAMKHAIIKSDLVLIYAYMVTNDGHMVSSAGAEVYAKTAKEHHVPVYVCANSWSHHAKSNISGIKIDELNEEALSPENVNGIICEYGIFKPRSFIEENNHHNPWLLS